MENLNATTAVIFLLFVMIATAVAAYFLYVNWKYAEQKWKEEKSILVEGIISRSAMNSMISNYISKIGKDNMFSLIYVDIDRFSEIIQAFGEKEANKMVEKITKRIREIGRAHV